MNMIFRFNSRLKGKILTAVSLVSGCVLMTGCNASGQAKDVVAHGKVQITFWYSGGKTAAGVMDDIIDGFNQAQDQYQVTGIRQEDYDGTYTKLQAGIAGNNAADIALLDSDKSRSLMQKDLLVPMDAYTQQDTSFHQDDFIPVFYNQCLDNNKILYAMPAYGTTQVMYYNRELFEKAGIRPEGLDTWERLADAARVIKESTGGAAYGWEPMWGEDNLIDMALSNGGSMIDEEGRKVLINTDAWVDSWEAVRKWIHEDRIMAVHYGGQGWEYWYTTIDDVLQNKAGGYTGSSGDQADLDFSIVGAMEQPGFNDNPSAPTADALQLVMLQNSSDEEKECVYEFMKYFTTPENQAKWSMGTGYVAVRESTQEVEEFKSYAEENPQALVPLQQASHGTPALQDPTGGKILDALSIAADKVELENVPAQEALDEAQKTAQEALDAL